MCKSSNNFDMQYQTDNFFYCRIFYTTIIPNFKQQGVVSCWKRRLAV